MKTRKRDLSDAREIGRKIYTIRTAHGMTQEQLAAAVGCEQPKISQYEVGKPHPDMLFIQKIADCYQVDLNYFAPTKGEHSDNENR